MPLIQDNSGSHLLGGQSTDNESGSLRDEVDRMRKRDAAAREILHLIGSSRDNEQPVFNAILENAARLCGAPMARLHLVSDDRTTFRVAASWGDRPLTMTEGEIWPLDPSYTLSRTLIDGEILHLEDHGRSENYLRGDPVAVRLFEEEGVRTRLSVPLLHDDLPIGSITLSRREIKPFTTDDIQLVEGFAIQAVIAIENAHQFRAIQTANSDLETLLEREAATQEILEVIAQSRDEEQPVFNVILETAARLCNAPLALFFRVNPERTHLTIPYSYGTRTQFVDLINNNPLPLDPEQSHTARAIVEKRTLQIADFRDDPIYRAGQPHRIHAVEVEGIRSVQAVPLLNGDEAIGVIILYRREVAPFDEQDARLVEIFAAQAAIAIENVRQFKALESLNTELGQRVEEQVDEIERMGRLKRFLPAAVADTVVSQGSDKMLSSHRALLGVLFCDIRGFTAFCETAEPEETIEVLQTYHEEMGKLINAHGAGVDHRMGDGIMVLFNDPLPCDDPARDTVRLAVAMRARMAELCKRWKRLGHRLGFGVGVSLGYATVGMVGFEGRFDYTASGTAINLASRLCDEADDGEILLSPRAGIAVEDEFQVEIRGEISLKGIREPLEVFRLTGAAAT